MPRFIDLSHDITDAMVTYPGLPTPEIADHLSREQAEAIYAPGVTFQIGTITMCSNTGTYLDVPFHRYADGHDLCGLELERVSQVPGTLLDCRGLRSIGPGVLEGVDVAGRAVLFHTGHATTWGTDEYFTDHPYLEAEVATALVDGGAACVGIDSLNIDSTSDGQRPVHSILLRAGIPIVEHLRGLELVGEGEFAFTAVPPRVEGMGTFTVRAHAIVP